MPPPTCDNYHSKYCANKAKKCILGHIWPHRELILDFLTSKFNTFISAQKSVSGESLVKFRQQMRKISC